jgi:hypothetical protein
MGLLGSRILHGNLYFCMALFSGRVTIRLVTKSDIRGWFKHYGYSLAYE